MKSTEEAGEGGAEFGGELGWGEFFGVGVFLAGAA